MIEKKIAIMQPYFFPYIGYFQLIAAVDKFIIYDDVNFINRGWINRNNILVNGTAQLIQVPLVGASQNKLINEVELIKEMKWKAKLLRTIEQSYKKAPQFLSTFELIQTLFDKEHSHISDFNVNSIQVVSKYLGIDTQIVPSSSHYQNKYLSGQNRILDICLKENANHYINPIGGVDLYDRGLFKKSNITLNFIQPKALPYPQKITTFVPFLSVIDILMNCELNYIKTTLLKTYELI